MQYILTTSSKNFNIIIYFIYTRFITVKLHDWFPSANLHPKTGQRDNETTPLLEGVPAASTFRCQEIGQVDQRTLLYIYIYIYIAPQKKWQCQIPYIYFNVQILSYDTSSHHTGKTHGKNHSHHPSSKGTCA